MLDNTSKAFKTTRKIPPEMSQTHPEYKMAITYT